MNAFSLLLVGRERGEGGASLQMTDSEWQEEGRRTEIVSRQ